MRPGSIGEISALLIILGGLYLIARKYVNWRLPLAYICMVFIGAGLFAMCGKEHASLPEAARKGLYHILAGGLMLGAFFMATDMVTSPLTSKGQVIFGIGAGVLAVLIRFLTGYPEGVCYSILLMNTATPIIDRHTKPKVFGSTQKKAKDER